MYFDGPHDDGKEKRLSKQHKAILELMQDGEARTLEQICTAVEEKGVKCPHASASAQLRHLRKPRFGAWKVEKTHLGNGLYSYRLGEKGAHKHEAVIELNLDEAMKAYGALAAMDMLSDKSKKLARRLREFIDAQSNV